MEDIIKKRISFSQFSTWYKCPHKFYLDRVKGLKKFEDSVNTCFGTAMHNAIQQYIKTLYTVGVAEADSLDLNKIFKESFQEELKNATDLKYTDDDYTEFVFDGEDIIQTFLTTSNRIKHFPSNKYEFVGVELEITVPIKNNIDLIAFLDLVLKDKQTGDIKILDFKTSSMGWNEAQQNDITKYSQLLLYKAIYSKKFGIPLHKIDVEFFILKRKLFENVSYPQSRIQLFIPPHKSTHVASTVRDVSDFITKCFTVDGEYITDVGQYPKTPGKNKKNCKYCPHLKNICDGKATKID